jgi:hypothetical protein
MEIIRWFKAECKFSHVGRGKFIIKIIAVRAISSDAASEYILHMPRIKKNIKDAIISMNEITIAEFYEITQAMSQDPYFKAPNIQIQRQCCTDLIIYEIEKSEKPQKRTNTNAQLFHRKKQIKNPHYYSRLYDLYDNRDEVCFYG